MANKRKKRSSKNYRRSTRIKSTTKIRRRRTKTRNPFLETLARYLRLILLLGIAALIIYFLFKPNKNAETGEESASDSVVTETADIPTEDEIISEPNPDDLPLPERVDFHLNKIFENFNIRKSWISKKGNRLAVKIPSDLPAIEVIVEIIQLANELDLTYFNKENLENNISQILIADKNDTLRNIIFIPRDNLIRKKNKMAIVIDDFGYYQNKISRSFVNLPFPLTLSIIPGQKHSRQIMNQALSAGKEIMIHLPMEPLKGKVEKSPFTILTKLSDEEIARRIQLAIEEIPEAVGINNHMGSKATADSRVMDIVCRELKKYDLIFVDSRTTNKSVAEKSAMRYHLPFLRRMVFLETENQRDEKFISRQFRKAIVIAKKKGFVVVIGHPYEETLQVLQTELPELENQGIELVPISGLKELTSMAAN